MSLYLLECKIYFIIRHKDSLVDQVIYEIYPDMQSPSYAGKYHGTPSKQLPHRRTGFLRVIGQKLGLNTAGADEDPNANVAEAQRQKGKFEKLFRAKLNLADVVKELVTDVNRRQGEIVNLTELSRWCGAHLGEQAHDILHDEDRSYPSYAEPVLTGDHQYSACLTDDLAYLILETLGYIRSS